jgi:hypothetical protein
MKKTLLLLILSTFFISQSNAQWVSNAALNTLVSDNASMNETVPMSAPGLNGTTYISWFMSNASGSYDAMLQLLDVNGTAVWPTPLVVSNQPQSSALYNSDFTTDHAGNAIMAFQDIRNGNLETVIYKISATGSFVWGNNGIALHDPNANFEAAPKVAVFDNDDVVVGWSASNAGDKWVAWQIISATGVTAFTDPQLIYDLSLHFSRVVPVVTGPSNFVLVYVQETGTFPGLTSIIYAQLYNISGTAQWASPIQVSSYGLGFVAMPMVVSDNIGGCYIGFNSGTPGAPAINDAFIQRIDASGAKLLGADGAELSALNGNHKFISDLFFNTNDDKVYTLLKVTNNSQNGAGVYIQALDLSGAVQFTNNALEIVPISTSAPCEPFAIDNAGNGCVITYTEGSFNNQTIKAHKVDYSGIFLFATPVTLSSGSSSKSRLTTNKMQGSNQLVVSWEDSRINQGIYAQNMNNDGTLGVITAVQNQITNNENFVSSIINNQINLIGANQAVLSIFNTTGQIV